MQRAELLFRRRHSPAHGLRIRDIRIKQQNRFSPRIRPAR
jgi:hypothetical protein